MKSIFFFKGNCRLAKLCLQDGSIASTLWPLCTQISTRISVSIENKILHFFIAYHTLNSNFLQHKFFAGFSISFSIILFAKHSFLLIKKHNLINFLQPYQTNLKEWIHYYGK